jgi:LemA protein
VVHRNILMRLCGVLVAGALVSGCGYNRLTNLDESVEQGWSEVENQLQRRADVIPNLVNTVKGYAAHEAKVFGEIAQARAAMLGAGTRHEKIEAAEKMEGALGRLLMISESYPQLKSDQTFTRLMDELAGTENRLAVARKRYNDAVSEYNRAARSIPTRWSASIFGFDKSKEYFRVEEGAKQLPQVDFGSR